MGVLGVLLALASIQFLKGPEDAQRSGSGISPTEVVTTPLEPKVLNIVEPVQTSKAPASSERAGTENTTDNEHSTVNQQKPETPVARPRPTSEKSRSENRIPSASSSRINLLSPENGGQIIVADFEDWKNTIDGNENSSEYGGWWVVFGFKNDGSAIFDTFKVWIPRTSAANLNEFELLAGNDSPTGKFESIGKFQTQNLRFFKDPWQEFKFAAVTARYLKLKVISTHGGAAAGVEELQLLGVLGK